MTRLLTLKEYRVLWSVSGIRIRGHHRHRGLDGRLRFTYPPQSYGRRGSKRVIASNPDEAAQRVKKSLEDELRQAKSHGIRIWRSFEVRIVKVVEETGR